MLRTALTVLPRLSTLLCKGLLLPAVAAAVGTTAAAQEKVQSEKVQSLHYGVSLFHYYQHQYFDALTELMVGEVTHTLATHDSSAPLLAGGMALSYGMDRQAETVFRDILTDTAAHADHDRAWFYLAKTAWQRGETDRSATLLGKMAGASDPALLEEAQYLQASALLNKGDPGAATSLYAALPATSRWRNYLSYNLGAQRASAGDWQGATRHFEHFTTQAQFSAEDAALRDKGLTAAGYAYLAAGEPASAQQAFRQVHADSPATPRALLGYGWAAAAQGDFAGALTPWQQLAGGTPATTGSFNPGSANSDPLNASTREGLLALPYAYAQLGRPALALDHYRRASSIYAAQLDRLNAVLARFRQQPVAEVLGIAAARSGDWLFDVDILPVSSDAPYLQHLLTRHSFQISLRELRDLYQIERRLQQAQERLAVLTEVDAQQQRTWAAVINDKRQEGLALRHRQIEERLRVLRTRLHTAAAEGDGRMLADAAQTERWSRLQRAVATAQHIDTTGAYAHKLRLLHGLLLWQDNEAYPARLWEARQALQQLEQSAAQSADALQRVNTVIRDKRVSGFSPRIVALQERVARQQQNSLDTIALAESKLRHIAIDELEHQADQLQRALGQSELAIAHLYDQRLQGEL